MKLNLVNRIVLMAVVALTIAGASALASQQPTRLAGAMGAQQSGRTTSSGPTTGYVPAAKLTIKSAKLVDMSRELVALPLHKGNFNGKTVWFIITDASDFGLAHDLDVNYAPKLANMAIGCAACVQEVTLTVPPGNKFADAIVNFQGIPDFSRCGY